MSDSRGELADGLELLAANEVDEHPVALFFQLATFVELFAPSGLLIAQPGFHFGPSSPLGQALPVAPRFVIPAGGRYYAMLAPTLFRAGKKR